MPTYGRSFTVPSWSDMKPPISPASAGSKGPITGEAGFLGYLEICLGIKNLVCKNVGRKRYGWPIFFWGGGTNDNTTRETQKAKIGNVFKGYCFF